MENASLLKYKYIYVLLRFTLQKRKYEIHTKRSEIHTAGGSYHWYVLQTYQKWYVMHTIVWYALKLIYARSVNIAYIAIILHQVHMQRIRQYS